MSPRATPSIGAPRVYAWGDFFGLVGSDLAHLRPRFVGRFDLRAVARVADMTEPRPSDLTAGVSRVGLLGGQRVRVNVTGLGVHVVAEVRRCHSV